MIVLLSLLIKGFQSAGFCGFMFSSYRPELYRCCLCWRDDVTLLIGWADMVQVGKLVICLVVWIIHQFVCLLGHSFGCSSLLLFVSQCLSVCSFTPNHIIFPQICVVKERLVQRSDLPPLVVEIGKQQLFGFFFSIHWLSTLSFQTLCTVIQIK